MPRIKFSAIAAILIVLGSMAVVAWAKLTGHASQEFSTRAIMVIIGLMNAGYANVIPKSGKALSARVMAIQRVVGWSMTLGGLAFAAAWAFAPMDYAFELSVGATIASILVAVGYCLANNQPKQAA